MTQQVGSGSVADHLAAAARVSRKTPPKGPDLPEHAAYLWNVFVELSACRGSSGFGQAPISFSEIDAYCRLKRLPMLPWEIEAIRALDDAFIAVGSERKQGDRNERSS